MRVKSCVAGKEHKRSSKEEGCKREQAKGESKKRERVKRNLEGGLDGLRGC